MSLLQCRQLDEYPRRGRNILTVPQPFPSAQQLLAGFAQQLYVARPRRNDEAATSAKDQEGHAAAEGTSLVDRDVVG